MCCKRYCAIKFRVPFINKISRLTNKLTVTLAHPLLTTPFLPFSRNLRCFAGAQWFCANRKAAEYFIEFHSGRPTLASHYRRLDSFTIISDESYYRTIFCNAPHLKVSQNNWPYIDWSTSKNGHPKTLLFDDLPKIYASSAHFARKFDIDADVRILNELDSIVG